MIETHPKTARSALISLNSLTGRQLHRTQADWFLQYTVSEYPQVRATAQCRATTPRRRGGYSSRPPHQVHTYSVSITSYLNHIHLVNYAKQASLSDPDESPITAHSRHKSQQKDADAGELQVSLSLTPSESENIIMSIGVPSKTKNTQAGVLVGWLVLDKLVRR